MATSKKLKITPFWLIVIMLLFIVGGFVLFGDVFFRQSAPEREAETPSPEWTTAPEGGVEVDLPDTPMRMVPNEEAGSEGEPQDEEQ